MGPSHRGLTTEDGWRSTELTHICTCYHFPSSRPFRLPPPARRATITTTLPNGSPSPCIVTEEETLTMTTTSLATAYVTEVVKTTETEG